METLKTAACWWNQINHCNNVRIMAKKWRASVNCKKLSYIYCASYRTRKTFKSFCCLILRDNLKIVVLTYFRGHWHYVWKNSRNHQGVCFRDLQKSGQMPNVHISWIQTYINKSYVNHCGQNIDDHCWTGILHFFPSSCTV